MASRTMRTAISVAALSWAVVGGYGLWQALEEPPTDDWEAPYLVFSSALAVAALATLVAAWAITGGLHRLRGRAVGLSFGVLGVAASIAAAWAMPLWMALLALGFSVTAVSTVQPGRRAMAALAGAQIVGLVALFAGISAELGRADEYGDHPMAFGIALVVTAAGMVLSLGLLLRDARRAPGHGPMAHVAS